MLVLTFGVFFMLFLPPKAHSNILKMLIAYHYMQVPVLSTE